MKFLFLIFFPTIIFAKAPNKCAIYEMQGMVRVKNNDLYLVIAEKTMSEKSMPVELKEEYKLSPFINRAVSANFSINASEPQTGAKIFKIENPKDVVIDVLNQNQKTTFSKIKEIKCLN
jgi:hypothetical protein